jgi:hypothetical protein
MARFLQSLGKNREAERMLEYAKKREPRACSVASSVLDRAIPVAGQGRAGNGKLP